MGKLFGIFLMILGAVGFFYGATINPQYPSISDSAIQIISIIVFVIGVIILFFAAEKSRGYR